MEDSHGCGIASDMFDVDADVPVSPETYISLLMTLGNKTREQAFAKMKEVWFDQYGMEYPNAPAVNFEDIRFFK